MKALDVLNPNPRSTLSGRLIFQLIFRSKNEDSRYWALPEGGMGEHPAGRKVDDLVVLLEFLMKNRVFFVNSSATMVSDHFYEVPGGYNSD